MILGMGLDMVEVSRIQRAMDRFGSRFLRRLFSPAEIAYCSGKVLRAECLAGTFAAKEAFVKALGTGLSGGISFLEVEVVRQRGAPPTIRVSGRAKEAVEKKGGKEVILSISHDGGFALAAVVIQ